MTSADGSSRMPSFMLAALGAVVFVSLIILGDAIVSVVRETDIIETPNASPVIAIVGIGAACIVLAVVMKRGIDRRASIGTAVVAALLATAAYVAGFFVASLGGGLVAAQTVTHLVTAGYVAVVFGAGVLVAASIFSLARHSGKTPQWPWERERDDE